MTRPQMMIAIDETVLTGIQQELAALRALLERVEMTPKPNWLPVTAYAKQVGKSEKTIRNWVRDGRVESRRDGTVLMIRLT